MHSLLKPIKYILALLLILILIIGGYLAYVLTSYYRIEDHQQLIPELTCATFGELSCTVPAVNVPLNEELSVTSWNIGFGAYTDQYSFFMDGGKYSRGFSEEAVLENTKTMAGKLAEMKSDFYLVQEVDIDSTRSYHIDQKQLLTYALPGRSSTFALNYDSPYLFYPFTEPHGKSVAGLLTLTDFEIKSAVRRSLPIQDDLAKLVDLDRCYTVNRLNTEDGSELVLYNFHLSAYTTDPTIANQQLEVLYEDMAAEYAAGNYVICGGDFNKDLPGNAGEVFGVSSESYTWAQPLQKELIPEGLKLVDALDAANPVPSCRNCDTGYIPGQTFVLIVDGFIVSDNVEVLSSAVVDTAFAYSDHNPVTMTFKLK
jgi:endonuclease/exonuclease/phosphatase family metal-dependent hydrolase